MLPMIIVCGLWIHYETLAHKEEELGFSFGKIGDLR